MNDPIADLMRGVQADNELRMRVVRAEKAAHGAVKNLRAYIEATDAWFKAAKGRQPDEVDAALKRLLEAHNAALDWAREEADRVRDRRS